MGPASSALSSTAFQFAASHGGLEPLAKRSEDVSLISDRNQVERAMPRGFGNDGDRCVTGERLLCGRDLFGRRGASVDSERVAELRLRERLRLGEQEKSNDEYQQLTHRGLVQEVPKVAVEL